jgi:cytochrome c peroxidase
VAGFVLLPNYYIKQGDIEMQKKRFVLAVIVSLAIVVLAPSIGSPKKVKNSNLSPVEELGKDLFFDKIASPDWMSCATCHAPSVGWTGPIPGINKHGAVYRGAVPKRFGNRKPPSSAYATLSPIFHYDAGEGLFVGGNFWDGRATGERLGNPAADQALGPFLNPVERNNPSKQAVIEQVAASKYAKLFEEVWGPDSLDNVEAAYDQIGLSIAAYEASSEVNQFSSKFDLWVAGEVDLTEQEAWGLELFEGKAMCSACHLSELNGEPPLFTDFTFDNLGVPKNPDNPFYDMDEVFLDDGTPINPLGDAWVDLGLGDFLRTRPEWASLASENDGKHKVPTLRNVDKRPGKNSPKAYMHNGVFKSLKEVVHFYNTRDVEVWPPPEVSDNVNTDELGDLGLTDAEEDAIVAFMKTLTDGYVPPKKAPPLRPVVYTYPADRELSRFQLFQNVPNPFNPETWIPFSLSRTENVAIMVHDMKGQLVRKLNLGIKPAGIYMDKSKAVYWDGKNEAGEQVSSGVYFYTIQAGDFTATRKMVMAK